MLVGRGLAEPDVRCNTSSNIGKEMLSSIGSPGNDSVRNSSSNNVGKMLHNIKLPGRHSPMNRKNINYNSK